MTNGKLIRLLVDDEPFDVRYGTLLQHERVLDLRDGVLRREVEWASPAGQAVRVRSTRLVSFVQRAVAAIRYEVEAVDEPARIVVQSTLVANEPVPGRRPTIREPRPRCARRWSASTTRTTTSRSALGHRTRASGLRMAAGDGPRRRGPGREPSPRRRASRTWPA